MGLRGVLLVGALLGGSHGYKWDISDVYGQEKLSFSELYMYGTNAGPFPLKSGVSYVHVELTGRLSSPYASANVTVMAFTSPVDLELSGVDLCRRELPEGVAEGSAKIKSFEVAADEDSPLRLFYKVPKSGLQYVALQVCDSWSPVLLRLEGTITFKNPYGFLPAMYFGFLPFELARSAMFVCFALGYLVLLCAHRRVLLPLHHAIFAAALLATAEACAWFFSYLSMNASGTPLCCPFPKHVIAAMTLDFLRRTFTRVLLLVVSLGHGVVRSRLTRKETFGVAVLMLGYLVASIAATVTKVEESSALHSGKKPTAASDLPVLFFDLCFLVWIYYALVTTMDTLKDQKQTYKLDMYARLSYTIGAFVALVSLLTFVIFASRLELFEWPWQLYWLQTVSLELLNFSVIAAVCVIWRPTEHSQLLVSMQQLSTADDGSGGPASAADDDDDGGLELAETNAKDVV